MAGVAGAQAPALVSNGNPVPHTRPPASGSKHHQHHHYSSHHKDHRDGHRKHEDDKRRPDKHKTEPAKALQQHAHQSTAENRLRRETPFLANIRFKNDLPEIPGDPKMLVSQLQPEKLAQFSLTTLEREPKRDLLLPPDIGIPISLLDVDRYVVPAQPLPLDPADAALLGGDEDLVPSFTSPGAASRFGRSLKGAEVSWLMRTTYIANDSDAVRKPGHNEKKAKSMREANKAEEVADDRESQIAAIEASFEAAQQPPVHAKNPALQPVEIMPVFPDFECWAHKYVLAHFDNDPTEEVEALNKLPMDMRKKVAACCTLKGFKLDNVKKDESSQASQEQRFMALLVPQNIPEQLQTGASGSSRHIGVSELEGDYTWSKEYAYDLNRKDQEAHEGRQEYFITFGDGAASYCDFYATLELKKRDMDVKTRGKSEAMQFARPSKAIVRRREPTAAELEDKARKMRRIAPEGNE